MGVFESIFPFIGSSHKVCFCSFLPALSDLVRASLEFATALFWLVPGMVVVFDLFMIC